MMEWTDRHCRFFHRLLTRHALIYTEMLTTGAVLRGDRQRLLGFDASECPVALQLGGCSPSISRMPHASEKTLATAKSTSTSAVRRIGSRKDGSALA